MQHNTHTHTHLTSLHVRHLICGARGSNTRIQCCSSAFRRNVKSNKFSIVSTGRCIVVVDVEMESHRDINKLHHHSNADDYRAFDPDFRVGFFSYFLRARAFATRNLMRNNEMRAERIASVPISNWNGKQQLSILTRIRTNEKQRQHRMKNAQKQQPELCKP